MFKKLEKLDARDARIDQMFRHLNELATYRSLRQLDSASEIPGIIWLPLLAGGLVVLVFAMILDIESRQLHTIVNGLLDCFLGINIYLIILLDHPFTGSMKIEPQEYKLIVTMATEDD